MPFNIFVVLMLLYTYCMMVHSSGLYMLDNELMTMLYRSTGPDEDLCHINSELATIRANNFTPILTAAPKLNEATLFQFCTNVIEKFSKKNHILNQKPFMLR